MDDDTRLCRPAPGSATDPAADDLFLIELELDARHPEDTHHVFGERHYGMRPDELAFVGVEITGPVSRSAAEASARRKDLRRDARRLLEALGYTIELTPGRDVHDVSPRREALSAHARIARLHAFRKRLAAET